MSKASRRVLMCPPDYFDVSYAINPWMRQNIANACAEESLRQWSKLAELVGQRAEIALIAPQPQLPDMVFTANAGLVVGQCVILSRFRHGERQGEERHFKRWFAEQGFAIRELVSEAPFEGAGDALLHRGEPLIWAGYGFRSHQESHRLVSRCLDVEVLSLRLVDERFYHLDTCFCPLADGYVMYYPGAFDNRSNELIEHRVPERRRITVSERDAVQFACNAVNFDYDVILNSVSAELKHRLRSVGFAAVETPLTEFLKSGGGAKCLTLCLTEQCEVERKLLSARVSTV